jgi:hypothetical protein
VILLKGGGKLKKNPQAYSTKNLANRSIRERATSLKQYSYSESVNISYGSGSGRQIKYGSGSYLKILVAIKKNMVIKKEVPLPKSLKFINYLCTCD